MEIRLDKLLVQLGLVTTRVRAEKVIQEIGVKVNGRLVNKPGKKYTEDAKIEMLSEEIPWVSMDAIKFVEALEQFKFEIKGKTWMDVGCSTGGATELLIHHGATKVYAIDGNKDILNKKVQELEQLVDLTGTPVRALTTSTIKETVDSCVINSPFQNMSKVFPFIHPFLPVDGEVIALVRPELEADKKEVAHNGQLRDKKDWMRIIERLKKIAKLNHLEYQKHCISPVLGKDGKEEYIFYFKKSSL